MSMAGVAKETRIPTGADALGAVFAELAAARRASARGLAAADRAALAAYGVALGGGAAWIDDDMELLSDAAVRAALTPRAAAWLAELDIRSHVGSTNSALVAMGRSASVRGRVVAAEVQTAGRGRRGRVWRSPFGRNLAVSVGVGVARPSPEMGAFSLVAGLAVRAALRSVGLAGVALKWPNDILLADRKLGGVLIEVCGPGGREAVVGIGVNMGGAEALRACLDEPVADVAEHLPEASRNGLLAALLNELVDAAERFAAHGFAPFAHEWERAHRHQNQTVAIVGPRGEAVTGTALGVSAEGALRLRTAAGVSTFVSGEVSLRANASHPSGPSGAT